MICVIRRVGVGVVVILRRGCDMIRRVKADNL